MASLVSCSECSTGHYRWRGDTFDGDNSIRCTDCLHEVAWSDLEDVYYNPQWRAIVAVPQHTLDLAHFLGRETGLPFNIWHTGGGCTALGADLIGGRRFLVAWDADVLDEGEQQDEWLGACLDGPDDMIADTADLGILTWDDLADWINSRKDAH